MGEVLKRRLAQTRFESPHHEAFLNLLVAAAYLRGALEDLCAAHGITEGQYNVLRILRGRHPDGYARCEVARRMVERAPDVTRLIDRLEAQGLAERERSENDRRMSVTRITRRGLLLLDHMQPAISGLNESLSRRLSAKDARSLSRLCEAVYGNGH
jgi:DNA-binding MarR family transcriptional regulator